MSTNLNNRFGKVVKKALIDNDMTQDELAKVIGTSPKYINHIVNGRRSPGKFEVSICATLGIKYYLKRAS